MLLIHKLNDINSTVNLFAKRQSGNQTNGSWVDEKSILVCKEEGGKKLTGGERG